MDTPPPKPPLSPTLAEFGKRVRARRRDLGLSQETAAIRCQMHWTNLARIERAQQSIRIETALNIADGLETTPGALLDGLPLPGHDEDPPPRGDGPRIRRN